MARLCRHHQEEKCGGHRPAVRHVCSDRDLRSGGGHRRGRGAEGGLRGGVQTV